VGRDAEVDDHDCAEAAGGIDLGVTIELVSFRFHNSRHAWEHDHDREREARIRGDEWRSFTYDDVFGDQTYMLGELEKLLT
jgi:hypothetical protein